MAGEVTNAIRVAELLAAFSDLFSGGDSDSVTLDGITKPSISKAFRDRFAGLQAMVQGRLAFATKSAMDADTTQSVNMLAEVWNDATPDNNGLYGWNGSAWVKSPYDSLMVASQAMSATDGYLDGIISRWEYTSETSVRFYLDEPVYLKVKDTSLGRLNYPIYFELQQLQVAYVDDAIRDETDHLLVQIVSLGYWLAQPPSHTRRVVASMAYNGIWSAPDLVVDPLEQAMHAAFSAGLHLKKINMVSTGATCDFYFGDGASDVNNKAFMGSGSVAQILAFTTDGKYTLAAGEGLWLDFGKGRAPASMTVQKTTSIDSAIQNGKYTFVHGSKVLLLSYESINGVPVFHGKLGQQAAAVWSAQQKDKLLLSSIAQNAFPPTQPISTKWNGTTLSVTVPGYCYVAFNANPANPGYIENVSRTGSASQSVELGSNQVCYVDKRIVDANGYLVPQVSSCNAFAADIDAYPYRYLLAWHAYNGYHGVARQPIEWLEKKIDLSSYIGVVDAKYGTSRDGLTTSTFVKFSSTPTAVWRAYLGASGSGMLSIEWSAELQDEMTTYGYIEIKQEQGLLVDMAELTPSGSGTIKRVDSFYADPDLGHDDALFLLLGFRRLNSKNNYFGQLADRVDALFDFNTGYYAQLDRAGFTADGSSPAWDTVSRTLSWVSQLVLLSPWVDEFGALHPRLKINAGSVVIPSGNYYVVWVNKRDLLLSDDSGMDSSKIRVDTYYGTNGWQGARDACVLGYCSNGNFTRLALPPVRGTLEFPAVELQTAPDVVIDVKPPTADLQEIRINLRDDGNENGNYIQWRFERYTKPDINSDVWHIQNAYVVGPDYMTTVKTVLVGGENETAIRESGKADFVGGTAHGDEISQWVNMQLDGNEIDPTVAGRYIGKTFRVQQHSIGYEEGTSAQVEWFNAWKSWEFSINGVEITQQLEFLRTASIDSFYNCFLCIARNEDGATNATTAQYGAQHPYYEKHDLISRNHPTYPTEDVTVAMAWGGDVHFKAEFLEGYGPQDPTHITYSQAQNYMFFQTASNGYNKMYFKQGFTNIQEGAKTYTRYRYKITSGL